jgi:outer membrane protein assembly factor BamE
MRTVFFCSALIASQCLSGCTTILENIPGVYKVEVQQGNIVDQTMIDQIRPNMTERQVLYILGSPMLIDNFRQKRWDYLYSTQPSGEERQQKKVSIVFDNSDQVIGIQGDFKPSLQAVARPPVETTVDVPKREIEKTMWQKITGLFGLDDLDDTPTPDSKRINSGSQLKTPL